MSRASSARRRLTAAFTVPADCATAYGLFTPMGERAWAEGWEPSFPAAGSTEPAVGLVWETSAHGHTTCWVVAEAVPSRRVRYARVCPGLAAGTVTVELEPTAAGSRVTVTYDLTALTEQGHHWLDEFAAGYEEEIAGWDSAITRAMG